MTLNSVVVKLSMEAYFPTYSTLLVCQDSRKSNLNQRGRMGPMISTLSDIGHHVIQDCLKGEIGDRESDLFFDEREEFVEFVSNTLTDYQIEKIIEGYRERGADEDTIIKEVEALQKIVLSDLRPLTVL